MSAKKRFALIGTGSRALMFRKAILESYLETSELVAVCDLNPLRMQAWLADVDANIPAYPHTDFDEMIQTNRVDTLIVTTKDSTHHEYIARAMELGCDVITEKPLTTDSEKLQHIYDAQEKTGRNLSVTFNYRYAPRNSKVKELLDSGLLGEVISVHFEWLLDTKHGADYFRRWHRDKANSGGLMVHKSTHHFDLVNWWLQSTPKSVYAEGRLAFYGKENAAARGVTEFYQRAHGDPVAAKDPFALHLEENDWMKKIYLDAESADGYQRDQSVFGEGINIEDDMSVIVRYANRTSMTYHLTAYSPWEGYRIAFNGTKGRLEYEVVEKSYVSAGEKDHNFAANVQGSSEIEIEEPASILWRPHWGKIQKIELPASTEGGHGGGDQRMLDEIFLGKTADDIPRAATAKDGAFSILTGVAANQSMATGVPVSIDSLLPKQLKAR